MNLKIQFDMIAINIIYYFVSVSSGILVVVVALAVCIIILYCYCINSRRPHQSMRWNLNSCFKNKASNDAELTAVTHHTQNKVSYLNVINQHVQFTFCSFHPDQ